MSPLEKKVLSHLDKWIPIVGLGSWEIHIQYYTDNKNSKIAYATTQPEYHELWLSFNTPKLKTMVGTELEKLVLHELCHAHTSALAQNMTGHKSEKMISYLDEQATSAFAHALWRAHMRR